MAETKIPFTARMREQFDALPPDERVCNWCASHDPATMEPQGPQCGRPAAHLIAWFHPGSRRTLREWRWSLACSEHRHAPMDPQGVHGWWFSFHELPS